MDPLFSVHTIATTNDGQAIDRYIALKVLGFPSYVLHTLTQHSAVKVCAQSDRELGIKVGQVAFTTVDVGEVFYFRQPGKYFDRYGKEFEYTEENLNRDRFQAEYFCTEYMKNIYAGYSEEQASNYFPCNIRQGFIMYGSAIVMAHLIANYDRHFMSDEYAQMLELVMEEMRFWMPETNQIDLLTQPNANHHYEQPD
jgi:hypothetical protein